MGLYSATFLQAEPSFTCVNSDASKYSCQESEFCQMYDKNLPQDQIEYNYHSFVQDYGLICDEGYKRSVYKQIIIFGAALIQLLCNLLFDVYGRRSMWIMFAAVLYGISFIANFVNIIEFKIAAMLCLNAQLGINNTLSSQIMNESCASSSKLRSSSIAIIFIFLALGGVNIALVSFKVEDPNNLFVLITCLPILFSIPLPFVMKEPPKNLFNQGKIKELFINLHWISKFNNKGLSFKCIQDHADMLEIDIEHSKQKIETKTSCKNNLKLFKESVLDLIKEGYLLKMFAFITVSAATFMIYYGVTYNSGQIGLSSIQDNVILQAGIETMCYVAIVPLIPIVRRKKTVVICIILCCVGAQLLVGLKKFIPSFSGEQLTESLIVSIIIKAGGSIWFALIFQWVSEVFPANIRGTCLGVILVTGKIQGTQCQTQITFSVNVLGVNAIVGCCLPCIAPLIFIWAIPETLGEKLA